MWYIKYFGRYWSMIYLKNGMCSGEKACFRDIGNASTNVFVAAFDGRRDIAKVEIQALETLHNT
jgi:hypothetical protein